MEVTDNKKTLANALAEIEQLRQKLEAAEAEIKRLESAWHVETLNRKDQLIAKQEAENDRLKKIIREAREQKPACWRWQAGRDEGFYFSEVSAKEGAEYGENITPLFISPVPAMPIQDDEQLKSIKLNSERYKFLRSIGGVTYNLTSSIDRVKAKWELYDNLVDQYISEYEVKPS